MGLIDTVWGRKFIACMSVQAAHTAMMCFDKIPSDVYQFLTMFIMGGYVAGNIGAEIVKKMKVKE